MCDPRIHVTVCDHFSASERKRRQVHRGEVHGQLPFETRGMDDPVPTIDFSPSGNLDAPYSLEREDVDGNDSEVNYCVLSTSDVVSGLLHVLDDLENASRTANDLVALAAVRECRAALEKLVVKMDSLESGFDRIAERSCRSMPVSRVTILNAHPQCSLPPGCRCPVDAVSSTLPCSNDVLT